MPIVVANWSDKQLDELTDLLKTADFSPVAAFLFENCIASGNRIMTDLAHTQLRVTVNTTDGKAVDLSPGVLQVGGLVTHVASTQTINILLTAIGTWGTGVAADIALPRWDLICIKNSPSGGLAQTPGARWFIDDTVEPNTYSQQTTNTERDMSYYDIRVVHGTPGAAITTVTVPAGYWCIAEVYVPADPTGTVDVIQANIFDTALVSQDTPKNWVEPALPSPSRVFRSEFWGDLFGIDHDPATGYHRNGAWHIGSQIIGTNGLELNALDGINLATVTAANLTQLTDGTDVGVTLHTHGGGLLHPNAIRSVEDMHPMLEYCTALGSFLGVWVDKDETHGMPAGIHRLWVIPKDVANAEWRYINYSPVKTTVGLSRAGITMELTAGVNIRRAFCGKSPTSTGGVEWVYDNIGSGASAMSITAADMQRVYNGPGLGANLGLEVFPLTKYPGAGITNQNGYYCRNPYTNPVDAYTFNAYAFSGGAWQNSGDCIEWISASKVGLGFSNAAAGDIVVFEIENDTDDTEVTFEIVYRNYTFTPSVGSYRAGVGHVIGGTQIVTSFWGNQGHRAKFDFNGVIYEV